MESQDMETCVSMRKNQLKIRLRSFSRKDAQEKEELLEKSMIKVEEDVLNRKTLTESQITIRKTMDNENLLEKSFTRTEENKGEIQYEKDSIEFEEHNTVYPWEAKWLKGNEYYQLLKHYKYCCETFGFQVYTQLPETIYYEPKSYGTMFYLKEFTFNDIHFPRVYHFKKKYKWKKMNFVTHLPKNDPQVSYLVASTTYTGYEEVCFRMHFVIPYDKCNDLMLCHILQIYPKVKSPLRPQEMINPFTKQEHPQEPNPNPSFVNVKKVKNESERHNLLKQSKLTKKRFIRKDKVLLKSQKKSKKRKLKKIKATLPQEIPEMKNVEKEEAEETFPIIPKVEQEFDIITNYDDLPTLRNETFEQNCEDYYNANLNPMRSFMAFNLHDS